MSLPPLSSPENAKEDNINGENPAVIPKTTTAWNTTFKNSDVVAPPVMGLEYWPSLSSPPRVSYPVSNTISTTSTSSQAPMTTANFASSASAQVPVLQNTRPTTTTANIASSVSPQAPASQNARPTTTPANIASNVYPPSSLGTFYPVSNTISGASMSSQAPAFQNTRPTTTTTNIASSIYPRPNHFHHNPRGGYNQRAPWNGPYVSRPPRPPLPQHQLQPARSLPFMPRALPQLPQPQPPQAPVYTTPPPHPMIRRPNGSIYNNYYCNNINNYNKHNNNLVFVPRPSVTRPSSSNVSVPEISNAVTYDLSARIVHQINYYFSDENLVHDDHLKKLMNAEGWVAVVHIANFRRIKAMTNDITLIVNSMKTSTEVEVKEYKLRKRHGWDKYIDESKKKAN